MEVKWKHGLSIAAKRGIVVVDFPDLVRVRVPTGEWVSALVSFAEDYIIIQDSDRYHPLYRVYPLDFPGTLVEFIAAEIESPSIPVARSFEAVKQLFKKWERIYRTAEWEPLDVEN